MESILEPLSYAFFQKGLVVATLSGALLGLIGVYIVLRGMSYIGHGLSHSIFGGFAAAQLFAAQFYALAAGIWGIASALAISVVTRKSRVGADAAIGVITIASFALGVALFAKFGTSGPSFENALFGSILGISTGQIVGLFAVSALTGQRVSKIMADVENVSDEFNRKVSTAELNRVLKDAEINHPPPMFRGRRLKLFYATQTAVRPPTFIIFVNKSEGIHFSYERYLMNCLRQAFGFIACPIRLKFSDRK